MYLNGSEWLLFLWFLSFLFFLFFLFLDSPELILKPNQEMEVSEGEGTSLTFSSSSSCPLLFVRPGPQTLT